MKKNPVQFAVVREDPRIESLVLNRFHTQRMLLVASGGCTALSLASRHPEVELTLLDPNPAQLDLVRRKWRSLAAEDYRNATFNVECDAATGLNQCGNFESLFRSLRSFVCEFVAPAEVLESLFTEKGRLDDVEETLFRSPWWPVAFRLFFSDDLLLNLFGPDAIQHAAPRSYPAYFQGLFERGLRREDAFDNYFLHHVWLGRYLDRPAALPPYLLDPPQTELPELVECTLLDHLHLDRFDFVGLSNVMDWMDGDAIAALVRRLTERLRPGTAILFRQLNNPDDLEAVFGEHFRFDSALGDKLLAMDRSLFYQSIHIGIRTES